MASSDLQLPLPQFLDAIGREDATPGGGSVSAIAGAMAAGLVEMAARFSHDWPDAGTTAEQARTLRERLTELARADAEAYEAYLAAGPQEKAAAMERATNVPTAIADAAREIGGLAAEIEEHGNPNLTGDAQTARELAVAVERCARNLVEINRAVQRDLASEPR